MSALTNPTANHASRVIEKHLIVQGKLTAKNIFTENEWKPYTPTVLAGGTFATTATVVGRWRLMGSTMEVVFMYYDAAGTGAASTGDYRISLPSGIIYSSTRSNLAVGSALGNEAATPINFTGTALITGTTAPYLYVMLGNEASTPTPWGNSSPAPLRLTTATSKTVTLTARFEIESTSPILLVQNN